MRIGSRNWHFGGHAGLLFVHGLCGSSGRSDRDTVLADVCQDVVVPGRRREFVFPACYYWMAGAAKFDG